MRGIEIMPSRAQGRCVEQGDAVAPPAEALALRRLARPCLVSPSTVRSPECTNDALKGQDYCLCIRKTSDFALCQVVASVFLFTPGPCVVTQGHVCMET